MIGTLINTVAILIGGTLGLTLGSRISERVKNTVINGLGLFTLVYGISLFIKTSNALIVLGSILIGIFLGEWWHIEEGVAKLAVILEKKFNRNSQSGSKERFIKGFLTTTLLFCIGPMAILGSIEDGLSGSINTLVVKSILDGFAAMAFASSLGLGVLFSSLPVLIYQGSITLLASQIQNFVTEAMINELTATGGILLLAIAISSLLEIKKIRTASFLPALLIAPILVLIISLLK